MRSGALALALILALGGLAPAPAVAQSPRRVVDESSAWLAYTGIHPIGGPWRLQLEAQLRQTEGGRQPQQRLYRTALLRQLAAGVRVGAGYAYVHSYPPEEFVVDPLPFDEHRSYQQLDLRHQTGPLLWDHRYRLEQRWVERLTTAGPARGAREGWTYTNRARYLARTTIAPGGGAPQAGEAYGVLWDELFVGFGRNVRSNVFDQNRFFAGAGYRIAPTLAVEGGYLNHLVLRANGTDVERNHTLLVGVFSDLALRR